MASSEKSAVPAYVIAQAAAAEPSSGTHERLEQLLRQFAGPGGETLKLEQDSSGRLVVILSDGSSLTFPGTEALAQAIAGRLGAFVEELRMSQIDISRILRGLERQVEDQKTWEDIIFKLDRQLSDILPRDGSLTWRNSASHSEHLNSGYDAGNIGRGLEHLPPMPSERYLFLNDSRSNLEVAGTDSEATDPRLLATDDALKSAGVGSGIRHLPPQPDGERPNIFNERRSETGAQRSIFGAAAEERARPAPPEARDDRYRVAEDGIVSGNLFDNDRTQNGTRDVRVVNPPAVGLLALRDDGSFTFTPPADFSGTLTFTYAFTDLRTGQTVEAVATIVVDQVVDAPRVGATATSFNGEEDTAILLAGLSVNLSDRDGSETLAVRLTGVPEGASFGGMGQNLGNGFWAFTPADIASGLTFVPPLHSHGTYNLVLQATTTETATGESATTTRPFSITIDAQADAPILTTGTTRANEDTSLGFGRDITYALVDSDGSERVSRVQLSGFPADVTVTYTAASGAFVALAGGVYSITGDAAAIRATLDSFAAQRPIHRDGDFQISVSVQTTDADGTTASTSGTHRLIVDAVADAPTVTGSATGLEDAVIAVPVTVNLVDTDGSERLAHVDVSGIPAGATFAWNTGLPGTVSQPATGTYRFAGTLAEIQGLLATLTIRPPANSDADFALTVSAVTQETSPAEAGGVATFSATRLASIPVTVTAVADVPTLTSTAISGTEDTAVGFGANVSFAVTDTDGSERISGLEIANIPTGATIGWNTALPGTVTNLGGGRYTVTGTEAHIRALTATLTITPPLHSDADFSLQFTVTATDNDGSTATRTSTQAITVAAAADAPTVTVNTGNFTVPEDTATALPGLGGALVDTDLSESLMFRISGVPTGAVFNRGTNLGGGIWSFTPADMTAGLIIDPPANLSGVYNLTLTGISTETNGGATAQTARAFTLTIGDLADPPTVPNTTSTGNEDAVIAFGANVTYALTDTDGSETISRVEIGNVPVGATLTYALSGAATVTLAAGVYRIEGTQADIRATLNSFSLQAPTNSDQNIALTVAVTSREGNGSTSTVNATHTLLVNAVADAPVVTGSGTGNEDAAISVPITATLGDLDGSETLAWVTVAGVPTGAVFAWNTGLPGTVTDLTGGTFRFNGTTAQIQALLASVTVTPPANSDTDFNLTVTARATESNPTQAGEVATLNRDTVFSVPVTVTALADAPSIANGPVSGSEDSAITFGSAAIWTKPDNDGSEWVSQIEMTAFPAGWTVAYTANAAVTVTGTGNGPYTLSIATKADEAALRAVLNSFNVTPPLNSDADATIQLRATTTDNDGSSAAGAYAPLSVTVNPVSDQPGVSTVTVNVEEDAYAAIGPSITWVKPDNDGSERVSRIEITGFPTGTGASVLYTATGGTVTAIAGGFAIEAPTEAALRVILDSFQVRQGTNLDTDYTLTVRAQTTDGTATASTFGTNTLNVVVDAQADAPTVPNGSSTGNEDATITFGSNITWTKSDNDGTEWVSQVTLAAFPAGWTVAYTPNAAVTVTGTGNGPYTLSIASQANEASLRTVLNSFNVTPLLNSDADPVINVSVRTTDADGSTATTNATHQVNVTAVSDTPSVSTVTVNVEEDAYASIGPSITWTKPDNDGSERISRVEITGFPTGTGASVLYTATGGTVTAIAGGFAIEAPTEAALRVILDTFQVRQGTHLDTDYTLTVRAQTTDGTAAASTFGTSTLNVVVDAQADAPTVPNGSSTGNEDATITFGSNITWTKPDNDGTEWVSQVTLAAFPAGWAVAYTPNAAVTVTGTGNGPYTLSIAAQANEATLRTVLNSFNVTPPANSDADPVINVSVRTTDADGSTATTNATHQVNVTAVSDTPSVSTVTVNVEEDAYAAIGPSITWTKPDNDGSERVSRVEITGFPTGTGASVLYTATGGTVTAIAGGFAIEATTEAALRTILNTFQVRQGTHLDTDYTLTVKAQTIDGTAAASPFGTNTLNVVVDAQADTPTLAVAAIAGNEDTAITFGDKITWTKPDNDGTEWINQITLSAFPVGWSVAYTPNAAVTVTGSGRGPFTLTIAAQASEATLRTVLNSFNVTPPANSDADFTIQATARTIDADGSQATSTLTNVPVTVNPVSDRPTVSVVTVNVEEDAYASIGPSITWVKPDNDGSERISRVEITGFPTGTGTSVLYNAAGGTVSVIAGGYAITAASEAAIRTILNTFQVRQGTNLDTDITLSVRARTKDGAATDSAYDTKSMTIVVDAQADAPTVPNGSSTGNEDATITFGSNITWTKPDNDGTEWVSQVTLAAFPAGWAVAYTPNAAVTVTGSANGPYTLSIAAQANEATLRTVLNSFNVTPLLNSDADPVINISVRTTDADGSTATTNATHQVNVTAVADAPSSAASNASGPEDTAIPLTLSSGASVDADGSETLSMRITGVPTGASFNRGTNAGGGVWNFSAADIAAGVSFTPPAQFNGTIPMTLIARSTETSNGVFAESTSAFTVTVNAILDPVNLSNSSSTANEDTAIAVGTAFNIGLVDLDGSQDLTYRVSGIPADYTVGRSLTGATTYTVISPGVLEFSGPNAADVITSIRTMTLTPTGTAVHRDANFSLTLDGTTVEVGGLTSTGSATHAVTVRAVADQPTISATPPTVNEDPGSAIALPITVALTDLDGSETLQSVDVIFQSFTGTVPTMGYSLAGGASASGITNGFRFTGTTAQIQAALATITVTPQTHNGSDITVRVIATSQESNPTEVGDVATLTASRTTDYTINMVPVADTPTVTTPGVGAPYLTEEDTRVQLTGLGGSLVDADTSETLSFQITGAPAGAAFQNTAGTSIGTFAAGTWTFTAAQVSAGIWFVPPVNAGTAYDMNLVSVATEAEAVPSRIATNAAAFRVVVDAQADAPTVTGATTGNEDTAITVGTNISTLVADADGSEYISSVTISGFPAGALVAFTSDPAVTITGSGLGPYTLSVTSQGDAAKLQTVLHSMTVQPTTHLDSNFTLTVQATAKDADGSTATSSASHVVTVRAVADAPTVNATNVSGDEDTTVALSLSASPVDADSSENLLSARLLDVPTGWTVNGNVAGGGTLVNSGSGVWSITAPTTAQLNVILASLTVAAPANHSGITTLRLEVTSTETATGGEVATATATTTTPFNVTFNAVADMPTLSVVAATGAGAGYEDQPIPLTIRTNLTDRDGSEVLSLSVGSVPPLATFVNGSGTAIGTNLGGGNWTFTQAELADVRIIPPPNSNADFNLTVSLTSTENNAAVPGFGSSATVTPAVTLPVQVIGVADTPAVTVGTVNATEDQPIPLGTAITSGALADTDGSEVLFYVISGLPAGVVPSAGTYIGGEWQIAAGDIAGLTIPVPPNFSGNYTTTYAPSLTVRAVAQEDDGHQTSVTRPLNVVVAAVMDAFAGWSPGITVNEDNNISLASAAFSGLSDNDGSEQIVSYTFNLNGVIAAAQIGGIVPDVATLISTYVTGTFTNNGNGTITVLAANLAGVALRSTAFLDSNRDFTIPVTALVSETGGLTTNVNGTYSVNLVGVADTPTAFAQNASGVTGQLVALNPTGSEFGGAITDTDVALGRTNSENIYYIVSGLQSVPGLEVGFFNSSGVLKGLNNNDGTWYLTAADLVDLHIVSRYGQTGSITLTLSSITVENDGSLATNATPTTFTTSFTPDVGGGGGNTNPLTPVITVTPITGNEDGNVQFTVSVSAAPGDPSPVSPTVSLFISGLPTGAIVTGAILNPSTGRYIATQADLNAGLVRIAAPPNFSGTMPITVEAVAMNTQLNTATTGPQTVNVTVTPDADGPAISASPAAGAEDTARALNLSVTLRDTDAASPEVIDGFIRVTINNGATLSAGTLVSPGVYDLTPAQLAGLTVTPAANWHGTIAVNVTATSREPGNGDTQVSTSNFNITVAPVADMPNATASNVSGAEESTIALAGLSASLVDGDGSEKLSVKIRGIPEGSILSAGGNNGDGSWTIPVAALATLTIRPPKDYSGVMSLELQAFTVDANGTTAVTTVPFTVTVTPVADAVQIIASDVTTTEEAPVTLNLNLVLEDTRGALAGETAAERLELTFTGLNANASMTATSGALVQLSATSWRFTGTVSEAATLAYVPAQNLAGENTITVSAVAIDGASRGSAVVDTFKVTTTPVADAPTLVVHAAAGAAGSTVALNIAGALTDTDGSETLSYRIANVPAGASFSAGSDQGGGIWNFTIAQMANLSLTLPAGATDFTLNVSAIATDGTNPTAAATMLSLFVDVGTDGANIVGDATANNLRGAANNDTLDGGLGDDTLAGGAGDDIYVVDATGDVVVELAAGGTDRVQTVLANYTLGADIELLTGTGSGQTLTGNTLDNQIAATAGSNVLDGGDGNDALTGGSGADSLQGGAGADTLTGGGGNDTLDGGLGIDLLTGGLGADTFAWSAGAITGPDTITDFSTGENDVLDIQQLLPGYNGTDPIADYVRLFETGGNTEVQIDTSGAANFTTSVAILQGVTALDLTTLRTNGNLLI